MSWYAINALLEAGIKDIALVVSPAGEEPVRQTYGDGSKFGAKITYVVQPKPIGLANAIMMCKAFVGNEPFVVYLGDNIMRNGIKEYVAEFEKSKMEAFLLTTVVPNPQMFGIVTLTPSGKIAKLMEKPKKPPSNLALVGVYFLRKSIFSEIELLKLSGRGEYEITEALQGLVDKKSRVEQKTVQGWWKDTGTVGDLLEANKLILHDLPTEMRGEAEDGCKIGGRVGVEPGAKVVGRSVLRGPCVIGEGSIIGPNAYVGPYTSIGKNVEIRDTEIENSIVTDNCKISCGGRIVDSVIGSRSTIGSATDFLPHGKRVVVGENSVVNV